MKLTYADLAGMIDHSLLHPTMTDADLAAGCAIAAKYQIPIHAVGVGESVDDLQSFQAREFANAIAGS